MFFVPKIIKLTSAKKVTVSVLYWYEKLPILKKDEFLTRSERIAKQWALCFSLFSFAGFCVLPPSGFAFRRPFFPQPQPKRAQTAGLEAQGKEADNLCASLKNSSSDVPQPLRLPEITAIEACN